MDTFAISCSACETTGPQGDSAEEARCQALDLGFERRGDGWICPQCAHEEALKIYCAGQGLCELPSWVGDSPSTPSRERI